VILERLRVILLAHDLLRASDHFYINFTYRNFFCHYFVNLCACYIFESFSVCW